MQESEAIAGSVVRIRQLQGYFVIVKAERRRPDLGIILECVKLMHDDGELLKTKNPATQTALPEHCTLITKESLLAEAEAHRAIVNKVINNLFDHAIRDFIV